MLYLATSAVSGFNCLDFHKLGSLCVSCMTSGVTFHQYNKTRSVHLILARCCYTLLTLNYHTSVCMD